MKLLEKYISGKKSFGLKVKILEMSTKSPVKQIPKWLNRQS